MIFSKTGNAAGKQAISELYLGKRQAED